MSRLALLIGSQNMCFQNIHGLLLIVVLLLKGWRMAAVAGFEDCVRAATTSVQPHMGRYLYHS